MYKESIDYNALEPEIIPTPEEIEMLPPVSKSSGTLERDISNAITRLKEWIGYIPDIERAYNSNFLTKSDEYKRIIKGLDDIEELFSGGVRNNKYVLRLLSQMYSDAATLQQLLSEIFKYNTVVEMPDGSLYGVEVVDVDTSQLGYWERYTLDINHKPPLVHAMKYIGGTYYYKIRYKHLEGNSDEFDGKTEIKSDDVPPRYTYYNTFRLSDKAEALEWLRNHGYQLDYKVSGGTGDTYRLQEEEARRKYSKSIEAAIKRALNALAGTSIGSEIVLGRDPPKLWDPSHPYSDVGGPTKPEVTPPDVPIPNPPPIEVDVSEWSESKLQQFLYGKVLSYADLISLGLLPEDFAPGHEYETLTGEQAFVIITLIREREKNNK